MSNSKEINVLSFPNEILSHIFSFLNYHEKIIVGATCKIFAQILYDESYWEKCCKEFFNCKKKTESLIWRSFFALKMWKYLFLCEAKERCVDHAENPKLSFPKFDICICEVCVLMDPRYRFITKTKAILQYKVKEEELFAMCRRIICMKRIKITFFLEKDVRKLAIEKYGSVENFDQVIAKSKDRSEKIMETKKRKRNEIIKSKGLMGYELEMIKRNFRRSVAKLISKRLKRLKRQ